MKRLPLTEVTDVRDGLYPILRKALQTLRQNERFSNSASVTNKIAESANADAENIYDMLVDTTDPRCKWPLVDGHGNFGFPPADPHYSEIRVTAFYCDCAEKSTSSNPDEPIFMPIPYVFCAGTIGSSFNTTKIPTHNLGEVIDATIALIQNPKMDTKDLLEIIKGPDILIGGKIENKDDLLSIYENGVGTIKINVSAENTGEAKDYASWYNLKSRNQFGKGKRNVFLPYNALLNDGKTTKMMSLKEILQNYIQYLETAVAAQTGKAPSNDELCALLLEQKKYAFPRATIV